MKSNKLTNKQDNILIFIKKYIAKNDYPPTVREIAKAVNLSSPATVHVHLNNLIQKGYIRRNSKNHRMLELLVPNEFETTITDEINIKLLQNNKRNSSFKVLKSSISKYNEIIAFKMDSDNMREFGILKDDVLLFDLNDNINDKDIILVNKVKFYLVSDNFNDGDFENVLGKLVKLYRDY